MRVTLGVWLQALCLTILTTQLDRAAASPEGSPAFEVLNYDLAANQDTPELCFHLSQTVIRQSDIPLQSFVATTPAATLSVRAGRHSLCMTGFDFGVSYDVTLKAGLPVIAGNLTTDARFHVEIPDRPPELDFASPRADVLARLNADGLPIRSVNTPSIDLAIFRISDRNPLTQSRPILTGDMIAAFPSTSGERVWRGTLKPKVDANHDVVTFLPIQTTLGALKPGLYVAVAWPSDIAATPGQDGLPTQYFTVSDIGLSVYASAASMLVGVRSLSTAAPAPNVDIAIVAADNRVLAHGLTDDRGLARFEGSSLEGVGADRPQAVYAYGAAGEFNALAIESPSIAAQPDPSRVRALLQSDRDRYRAGDMVGVSVWTRDGFDGGAKSPLAINIYRPNGALFDSRKLEDQGAGGRRLDFVLPRTSASGKWRVEAVPAEDALAVGATEFEVAPGDTKNMTIALSAEAAVLDKRQPGTISIQTQSADGAAAANSPGDARVSIEPAIVPFPAFAGFGFGLADETEYAKALDSVHFSTDPTGEASVPLSLGAMPASTRPLDVQVHVRALDAGGRAVEQSIESPVANESLFIGVKPASATRFPVGQAAHFEVVALSRDGARQEKPKMGWEVVRSDFMPSWAWDGARFIYRASVKDTRVGQGAVDVPADSPGLIDLDLQAGRYRIEVFDPKGEADSSAYFSVGEVSSAEDIAADLITLATEKPYFNPGEGADIFVKPPYDSDVTLVSADTVIRGALVQRVSAAGAHMHIDTPRDARTGLALMASAVAAPVAGVAGAPRRAAGFLDLAINPAFRVLNVKLDIPDKIAAGQVMAVPVSVTGAGDEPAFIELIAHGGEGQEQGDAEHESPAPGSADDAFAPAPAAFDVYSRIITPVGLPATTARTGAESLAHDSAPSAREAPEDREAQTVSASSGIVPLDKNGNATVQLPAPDFLGRLSVRAIAWSTSRRGEAEGQTHVQYPVFADLQLPNSLAPDDRAELTLALRNVDGPRGEYHIALHVDRTISLQDDSEIVINLAEQEQRFLPVTIVGRAPGPAAVEISVTGPNGIKFKRRLVTVVRADAPPVTRHTMLSLKPGATMTLDPALSAGLRPDTLTISLAASIAGGFDLPGLNRELREMNLHTADRIVDAAAPLLAAAPSSDAAMLAPGSEPIAALQLAGSRLLDFQSADGGFTLWGSGASDPWLSAYAAEFITRARIAGAAIPDAPFNRALDFLTKFQALEPAPSAAWQPSPATLESAAYAAKVLAMNKRFTLFQLRYFAETAMPRTHSSVTIGLLAAAFATLDDKPTSAVMFTQALALLGASTAPDSFASDLRDHAMLTALMAESAAAEQAVQTGFARVFADAMSRRLFSAQEAAWVLRAQLGIRRVGAEAQIKLGDNNIQGEIIDVPAQPGSALPPLKNLVAAPLRLAVTISGVPTQGDAKDQSGYEAQRTFFDTTGKTIDPTALKQNDLVVVVVSGRYSGQGEGRPIVIETLPAGWRMEAASIVDPATRYPWLKDLSAAAPTSMDVGYFATAPLLTGERREFKIAYVVRAAVRGQFAMPGTLVEDMIQPGLSARGPSGRTKIDAPAL